MSRKSANRCKSTLNCCKNILLNVQGPTADEVTHLQGESKTTATHYHQPHYFCKVIPWAGDRKEDLEEGLHF